MNNEFNKEEYEIKVIKSHLIKNLSEPLYNNRFYCLREYIANAFDACLGITFPKIEVGLIDHAIIIKDNGRGMERMDIIEGFTAVAGHVGNPSAQGGNIGKFGVGVMSAFMIARLIVVETRSEKAKNGWRLEWEKGSTTYTLEQIELSERGTRCELHLMNEQKYQFSLPMIKNFVSREMGLLPIPIKVIGHQNLLNAFQPWVEKNCLENSQKLLGDPEAYELTQLYANERNACVYFFSRLMGKGELRVFLGIPIQKVMRFGFQKIAFFSKGVRIEQREDAFLPVHMDFFNGIVDAPGLALRLDREGFAHDENFRTVREQVTNHILLFMEKLAEETPNQLKEVLETFGGKIISWGFQEKRIMEILVNHYRFSTTAKRGYIWADLLREITRKKGGEKQMVVYFDPEISHELLSAVMHRGYEVVLAFDESQDLLIELARKDKVRIIDAKTIIEPDQLGLPPAYIDLRRRIAAAYLGSGIPSIDFVDTGTENSPAATFRLKTHIVDSRRNYLSGEPEEGRTCGSISIEALWLNVSHPVIRKLAENNSVLTESQVNRAGELLFCVATLNSPLEGLREKVKKEIVRHLIDAFLEDIKDLPDPLEGGIGTCFMALPYRVEFDRIWKGVKVVLEGTPYYWKMIRGDESVKDAEILSSIIHQVHGCQRFIADISGQNQNVLLELGMMLQKDPQATLILCDEETAKVIPADLKGRIFLKYNSDLRKPGRAKEFESWFKEAVKSFERFTALRGQMLPTADHSSDFAPHGEQDEDERTDFEKPKYLFAGSE